MHDFVIDDIVKYSLGDVEITAKIIYIRKDDGYTWYHLSNGDNVSMGDMSLVSK